MTMMTFITPTSDTGERISLVLTSLVSMFFFLKMVAERTPTSDTIPLLSIYFVMLSFEVSTRDHIERDKFCITFNDCVVGKTSASFLVFVNVRRNLLLCKFLYD